MKITNSNHTYNLFLSTGGSCLGADRQLFSVSGYSSGDVSTFKPNLELLILINQLLSEWLSKKGKTQWVRRLQKIQDFFLS